ncbi:MAG: zinc ribbon domain-containing protein [Promethearchaeota archaeon]
MSSSRTLGRAAGFALLVVALLPWTRAWPGENRLPGVIGEAGITTVPRPSGLYFGDGNASLVESTLNDSKVTEPVTILQHVQATVRNCTLSTLYIAGYAGVKFVNSTITTLCQVYEYTTVEFVDCAMGPTSTVEGGGEMDFKASGTSFNVLRIIGGSEGTLTSCTVVTLEHVVNFKSNGSITGSTVTGNFSSNLVETGTTVNARRFQVKVGGNLRVVVTGAELTGMNLTDNCVVEASTSDLSGVTEVEDYASLSLTDCTLRDKLFCWGSADVRLVDCDRASPTVDTFIYAYQTSTLYVEEGHFGYLYCLGDSKTTLKSATFDFHCFQETATVYIDPDSSVGGDICPGEGGAGGVSWDEFYLALTVIVVVVGLGYVAGHEIKAHRRGHARWAARGAKGDEAREVKKLEKKGFMRSTRKVLSPNCPACGVPAVPGPFNHCNRCGRDFCPRCSATVPTGSTSCPRCEYKPKERGVDEEAEGGEGGERS